METVFCVHGLNKLPMPYRGGGGNPSQIEAVSLASHSLGLRLRALRKCKSIPTRDNLARFYPLLHLGACQLLNSLYRKTILIIEQENVESMRSLWTLK